MRRGVYLSVFFILSIFLPFFPFSQVQGLSYSYTVYVFYIREPQTIQYQEMYFTVGNTYDYPIWVNCTFKPKLGMNISVDFEWQVKYFAPNEIIKNHYIIHVGETFSGLYELEMDVVGYTKDVGEDENRILAGGTVAVGIRYFGNLSGYLLELDITDQAGNPRFSTVIIRYRSHLYSDFISYTPIHQFNGTYFSGYLPEGYYQVFAKDLETNWVIEEMFELSSDTYKNLQLELVRLDFIPIFDEDDNLGVNITILNRIEILYEVEIYAQLYRKDKLVSETNKEYRSEFLKAKQFRIELWMKPFAWRTGEYQVICYIDSLQQHIAFKQYIFPKIVFDPYSQAIAFGLGLGVVILIGQYIYKQKKANI